MITITEIQKTKIYKGLDPIKDFIKLKFINSLSVQKLIIHGYTVARHTGEVPTNISGTYKDIVNELLEQHN